MEEEEELERVFVAADDFEESDASDIEDMSCDALQMKKAAVPGPSSKKQLKRKPKKHVEIEYEMEMETV